MQNSNTGKQKIDTFCYLCMENTEMVVFDKQGSIDTNCECKKCGTTYVHKRTGDTPPARTPEQLKKETTKFKDAIDYVIKYYTGKFQNSTGLSVTGIRYEQLISSNHFDGKERLSGRKELTFSITILDN